MIYEEFHWTCVGWCSQNIKHHLTSNKMRQLANSAHLIGLSLEHFQTSSDFLCVQQNPQKSTWSTQKNICSWKHPTHVWWCPRLYDEVLHQYVQQDNFSGGEEWQDMVGWKGGDVKKDIYGLKGKESTTICFLTIYGKLFLGLVERSLVPIR